MPSSHFSFCFVPLVPRHPSLWTVGNPYWSSSPLINMSTMIGTSCPSPAPVPVAWLCWWDPSFCTFMLQPNSISGARNVSFFKNVLRIWNTSYFCEAEKSHNPMFMQQESAFWKDDSGRTWNGPDKLRWRKAHFNQSGFLYYLLGYENIFGTA